MPTHSTKKPLDETVQYATASVSNDAKRTSKDPSDPNFSTSTQCKSNDGELTPSKGSNKKRNERELSTCFYSIGSDKRPHVSVEIKGQSFVALVDTGAQSTVVGSNYLDALKQKGFKLNECKLILYMADRTPQYPLGQMDIEYTIDNQTRIVPTIIMNKVTKHVILGINFLDKFDIKLDKILRSLGQIANTSATVEINEIDSRDYEFLNFVKQSMAEELTSMDMEPKPTTHCESNSKPFCVSHGSEGFIPLTAKRFIEWINYEEPDEGIKHIASTEPEMKNISDKLDDIVPPIYTNKVITAEDHLDQELDIEPPKISPVTVPHTLTPEQQSLMNAVLELFVHTTSDGLLNSTTAIEHIIDTGDAKPIMRRQYPMSPVQLEKVQKELDRMADMGIITEIKYSPWRSPVIAVSKKDGGVRVCLDARELNKVTIPNAFPIMDTNSILAQLKTTRYMSSIDLSQAFHQIPLEN